MNVSDYLLSPQPGRQAPTIILQLIDGHIVATTGPRPVTIELPYKYGWDEAFQEETSDIVAAMFQITFELTDTKVPLMVQKTLDEFAEVEGEGIVNFDAQGLGDWLFKVLHGADPR